MTRKEMNRLQIPGLNIKNNQIDRYSNPRITKNGIFVADYPAKLGEFDDVTLNYVVDWEMRCIDNKAYDNKAYVCPNNRKTIVYKFLTPEYITNLLMGSLNDLHKCVKQMKAYNKKQELEKDFYE